jgi:hypothetical protein
VPRITPAQRVGVTPRPAPLPLRKSAPSATPRRPAPSRRPAAPAKPREGRSAGTVALLVGLAVLILGGGAFVGSQVLGGGDEPQTPNRPALPATQAEESPGGGAGAAAKPPAETNVAVLNGTTQAGLAATISDRVVAQGYQRGVVETNRRDQAVQASTVYHAEDARASARAVAELLSIRDVQPLDAETQSLAPEADVVVLAGADQAP